MRLPSEHYLPGNPKPIGFVDEPDGDHIERSSELIRQLASHVHDLRQPSGGQQMHIRLCHVRYAPGMPFNLFGFNVWDVRSDGKLVDPFERGELHYALVVNQPAELQLEVAAAFLMELAGRQRLLPAALSEPSELATLEERTRQSDEKAVAEVADRFRYGWREGVRAAVEAAVEAGFVIEVTYELDVFPRKEDLDLRLPWLRRVYNEVDAVRAMVDKTVSMIGGTPPAMRAPGGAEEVRKFTQQHIELLDIRRYTNHATRDGEVCGNGYLVISETEPFAAFCARPESVTILPSGLFVIDDGYSKVSTSHVAHVRGIEQLSSPYGISLLEPFVFVIQRADSLGQIKKTASRWLGAQGLEPEVRQGLQARIDLVEQMLESTRGDVNRLVNFFQEHVPQPRTGLYLPGQELYEV